MRTLPRLLCSLTLALAGCRGKSAEAPAPVEPSVRPLSALAAQHVIVAPAFRLRSTDPLGWSAQIPRTREYLKTLDDEIAFVLAERGLKTQWVYPADLLRSMRGNPTYAIDPYTLAADPLRNPDVKAGAKLSDPLVTQLRTLVALQDARAVLLPVELRFEKDKSGQGIAILRLALLDGRLGEVRWINDVKSDPSPTFSRALLASLAGHVADLITTP
ncbi:MAG: hypothetical protein JWL95_1849 [Gemmatimonadetes bacterium]|nr:hypothetical protein [Gemmatimonadota bacterium]